MLEIVTSFFLANELFFSFFKKILDLRSYRHYQTKRYCPFVVALEGSVLWGNILFTAFLHGQNRTTPFGLIVHQCGVK